MFMFNSNNNTHLKSQDALGNNIGMKYPLISGNINLHNGNGIIFQGGPKSDNCGVAGCYGGRGCVNHQNCLDHLIKHQQIQLQRQQQHLFLAQQQYEYNLQLQYQYQMQQHLNQSHLNMHQNPQSYYQQRGISGGGVCAQLYGQAEEVYPEACYPNNHEELQVLEPYEIIILPKCDNTVTVRDVSHIDLSKNKSSASEEVEIEVEIKKGDKDIELGSIRDELLSEEKINLDSDQNQEIEVNVYETRTGEREYFSKEDLIQGLNLSDSTDSVGNYNIEVDLKECFTNMIQDGQILGSDSELEEVYLYDNQGEIEIEEDSVLVIKYKNERVETDILNLMEQNIDNCVIDGNSYYYENFVRSFSSGDYSSYENQTKAVGLVGFGGSDCYFVNDPNNQDNQNYSLIETWDEKKLNLEQEPEQEKEQKEEEELLRVEQEKRVVNTKNDKEGLEELNEKIQRFNLLLEKINKMEQMNISFKEAFLSEKWKVHSNSVIESKKSSENSNTRETQPEDGKSESEYSALDTVKDIYDSNSHLIYKDSGDEKCISSFEELADVESEFEQGEEQVQSYIQAINEYFAREGLLGVCESRLNTHRWERNYESAMISLNNQFKDSLGSDTGSEYVEDDSEDGQDLSVQFVEDYNVSDNGQVGSEKRPPVYESVQLEPEDTKCRLEKSSQIYTKEDSRVQLASTTDTAIHVEAPKAEYPGSTSGAVLLSNNTANKASSNNSPKSQQRVKIPMINIPRSNESLNKTPSSFNAPKGFQREIKKKTKTPLQANSAHKNACLAGNLPSKDSAGKDDEILARLSQCRVINSKTIRQTTNNNNSTQINTNSKTDKKSAPTPLNHRPRISTCTIAFSSSNYSSSTYNNFSQHANKSACEKVTRGPVYYNSFGSKSGINQYKPHVSAQVRKEPNLGFKSLITSGIKVNMTELMKPRVIRK